MIRSSSDFRVAFFCVYADGGRLTAWKRASRGAQACGRRRGPQGEISALDTHRRWLRAAAERNIRLRGAEVAGARRCKAENPLCVPVCACCGGQYALLLRRPVRAPAAESAQQSAQRPDTAQWPRRFNKKDHTKSCDLIIFTYYTLYLCHCFCFSSRQTPAAQAVRASPSRMSSNLSSSLN